LLVLLMLIGFYPNLILTFFQDTGLALVMTNAAGGQ